MNANRMDVDEAVRQFCISCPSTENLWAKLLVTVELALRNENNVNVSNMSFQQAESERKVRTISCTPAKRQRWVTTKMAECSSENSDEDSLHNTEPWHSSENRRGPRGKSRFKGVCITRAGKWRAVIYIERKQNYLGVFESEIDAARAYNEKEREAFPGRSPTNDV